MSIRIPTWKHLIKSIEDKDQVYVFYHEDEGFSSFDTLEGIEIDLTLRGYENDAELSHVEKHERLADALGEFRYTDSTYQKICEYFGF